MRQGKQKGQEIKERKNTGIYKRNEDIGRHVDDTAGRKLDSEKKQ